MKPSHIPTMATQGIRRDLPQYACSSASSLPFLRLASELRRAEFALLGSGQTLKQGSHGARRRRWSARFGQRATCSRPADVFSWLSMWNSLKGLLPEAMLLQHIFSPANLEKPGAHTSDARRRTILWRATSRNNTGASAAVACLLSRWAA